MNFMTRCTVDTPLTLTHPLSNSTTTIKLLLTYKFLGIMFDPKLRWNAQADCTIRSAEAWINLIQ